MRRLEDPCEGANTSCLIKGEMPPAGMLDFCIFAEESRMSCRFLCALLQHLITRSVTNYMYPSKVMFKLLVMHFNSLYSCLFSLGISLWTCFLHVM